MGSPLLKSPRGCGSAFFYSSTLDVAFDHLTCKVSQYSLNLSIYLSIWNKFDDWSFEAYSSFPSFIAISLHLKIGYLRKTSYSTPTQHVQVSDREAFVVQNSTHGSGAVKAGGHQLELQEVFEPLDKSARAEQT